MMPYMSSLLHAELYTTVTGYHKPHHCSHRLYLSGQLILYFMCHFPWLHKTVSSLKFSFILICLAPTTMSGTVTIRHVIATWISTQNVICKSSSAWPWQTTKCFWSSVFSFVKWKTVHTYPNTYIELCEIPSQSMHSISRKMTHYYIIYIIILIIIHRYSKKFIIIE